MSSKLRIVAALSLALSAFPAWAGLTEDVVEAANRDLPEAQRRAAWDRIQAAADVPTLQRIGADLDRPVQERWVAIRALGPIQTLEAQQALTAFMSSKDVWARIAAIGAIGERGDRRLAGRVAAKLEDPAIMVRAAAAEALGKLKDPSVLPDLERALKDPTGWYRGTSLWVRRKYVEAMAELGRDAAPYLARALDDADPVVVEAARAGLEKIAGFNFRQGRTVEQEREAWRRWAGVREE